jgi:predicted nucleotide-binding protein
MTKFELKKVKLIKDLENYQDLINQWSNNELGPKESDKLRSNINRKKPFVEDVVNRTNCAKRFDWSPPPVVGGPGMKNVNPFDVFFNPPFQSNVTSIIIDAIDQAIGVLENITEEDLEAEILQEPKNQKLKLKKDIKAVFIVHGHDNEAKLRTARFIVKLGFNPIILHEQPSSGKTIIEKIECYSNVGFGIVLYTPCDVGSVKNDTLELKNRARQNVVFEHGFLIGKIGRENVCALVKEDIETPNDISGVVYIKMDSEGGWQFQIAQEMKRSGYEIDMNRL